MASPSWVNPGTGLSPPASKVRIVTGRLPAQRKHGVVGQILRFLVRQSCFPAEQKLGAHQADAVGILRVRVLEVLDTLDIDQEPYLLSAP